METSLRVAAVQMDPKILDTEGNLTTCLGLARVARDNGARLIVFPECALTGYMFTSLDEAWPVSQTIPGPSTDKILNLCQEMNVYIVFGMLEKEGVDCYNAAVLLGPSGVVAKSRKSHLPCLGVDRFVKPGNLPIQVYETELCKIGMGICYDANFPEHPRILALNGADVLIYPANWPLGYSEFLADHLIPTRAIENRVYVIACNRVGEERGTKFMGRSKIAHWHWDPTMSFREGKPTEQDIVYADIEPASAREKHVVVVPGQVEVDYVGDRRPELYGNLTEVC